MKFELTMDIKDEDIGKFIKLIASQNPSYNQLSEDTKFTLTINEASKMSGIGRCKIMELCHGDNDFPVFRVGTKFLINRTKFIEWLNTISENNSTL